MTAESLEKIRESLLVVDEKEAESLRAYLAREEEKRRSDEFLELRLRIGKVRQFEDFSCAAGRDIQTVKPLQGFHITRMIYAES